jgi:hypothetical protein
MRFGKMIQSGAVQILSLGIDNIPRMRELMRKYRDLPMDLADAGLVRVAERAAFSPWIAATFKFIVRPEWAVSRSFPIDRNFHLPLVLNAIRFFRRILTNMEARYRSHRRASCRQIEQSSSLRDHSAGFGAPWFKNENLSASLRQVRSKTCGRPLGS